MTQQKLSFNTVVDTVSFTTDLQRHCINISFQVRHLKTRLEKLLELCLIGNGVQDSPAATIAADLVGNYFSKEKAVIKDQDCLRIVQQLEQNVIAAIGDVGPREQQLDLRKLLAFYYKFCGTKEDSQEEKPEEQKEEEIIAEESDDDADDDEDAEISKREGKLWKERQSLFAYLLMIESAIESLQLKNQELAKTPVYNIFALGKRSFFVNNQLTNFNAIQYFHLSGRDVKLRENNRQAFTISKTSLNSLKNYTVEKDSRIKAVGFKDLKYYCSKRARAVIKGYTNASISTDGY